MTFNPIIAILWIIASIPTIFMARNRGRSKFGWFLLAYLVSPIGTWLILAAIGEKKDQGAKLPPPPVTPHDFPNAGGMP